MVICAGARKFTRMTHSSVAWSSLVVWRRMGTPALFTRQSRWPKRVPRLERHAPGPLDVGQVRHPHPRVRGERPAIGRAPRPGGPRRRATRPTVAPRRGQQAGQGGADPRRRPGHEHPRSFDLHGAHTSGASRRPWRPGARRPVRARGVEHDHGHPRRDPAVLGRRRRHLRRRPRATAPPAPRCRRRGPPRSTSLLPPRAGARPRLRGGDRVPEPHRGPPRAPRHRPRPLAPDAGQARAAAAAEGLDIAVVVAPPTSHRRGPTSPAARRVRRRHRTPPAVDAARPRRRPRGVAGRGARREARGHRVAVGRRPTRSRCAAGAGLEARSKRWRGTPPDHHGAYPAEVRGALPLGIGHPSRRRGQIVAEAGWPAPRLVRLRDVEWASTLEQRLPERLLGVTPRFAVVAT